MEQTTTFEIGKEFQPSLKLKSLYFMYLFLGTFLTFLLISLPMIFLSELTIFLIINLPILLIILLIAYWIPFYYKSIAIQLTENEIIWKRGVWFKITGVVPYSKLTNLDILQGPIARHLGIGTLKIQTAGYSGQNASSEIKIEGIEQLEELRDVIMRFVQKEKPQKIEEKENLPSEMLNELVKIRKTLEEMKQ